MAKQQVTLNGVEFIKAFGPLVKAGKSPLEIGKALGFKGTDEKVALAVSAKASQLRKMLKEAALADAAKKEMEPLATKEYVDRVVSVLPRIKGNKKTSKDELIAGVNEMLAALDAPDEGEGVDADGIDRE